MDISKNTGWFAKLEGHGNKALTLTGSIQQITIQMMHALRDANPRAAASGVKQITLTIRDQPFDVINTSGLPQDFLDALDMTGIEVMTEEEQTKMESELPIWTHDPEWKQFRYYQATQSNYVTAMPGEVKRLQDSLKAKYGGMIVTNSYGVAEFDQLIVDKRSAT
jgi:hypothetical protein